MTHVLPDFIRHEMEMHHDCEITLVEDVAFYGIWVRHMKGGEARRFFPQRLSNHVDVDVCKWLREVHEYEGYGTGT